MVLHVPLLREFLELYSTFYLRISNFESTLLRLHSKTFSFYFIFFTFVQIPHKAADGKNVRKTREIEFNPINQLEITDGNYFTICSLT